jgi:DNA polymerase-3 subunit gamma/tau
VSYTVLARKYRSRTFDEVIGQGPIATTLVNAIKTGRLHHGYLFTGTRGSGKTSMARILAKALNCLKYDAPTTTPCMECDACRSIAEGQDIDVVEIDAASNTGVDNIRELRANTAFRPARSRFKIYIIDEVHMLSTGAFNALLKTLEEPPEHVKFILATTEFQKVPATIRSRCQCYHFRNITPDAIAERLALIAKNEGAKTEDAVLRRVARLANGSMRDALSIFDQLLAVSPKNLTAAVLDEILPPAQDEQIFQLLDHAARGDVAAVLTGLDAILSGGRGLDVFCSNAIEIVRTLMLVRACGPDSSIVDFPAGARDEYTRLSTQFELSQFVQMIAMLEELRRNVRFSGSGRALADALLVRLARMREWTPIEQILANLSGGENGEKKKPQPPLSHAAGTTPAETPHAVDSGGRVVVPQRTLERATVEPARRPLMPGEPVQSLRRPAVAEDAAPLAPQYEPPAAIDVSARSDGAAAASCGDDSAEPIETIVDSALADDEAAPRAADSGRAMTLRRPVTGEERARILSDPVVKQALDLFNGIMVNMERIETVPAAADESDRGSDT